MNKVILRFDCPFWGKSTVVLRTVPKEHPGPVFFVDQSSATQFILVGLVVQSVARHFSALPDQEVFEYFAGFLTDCMSVDRAKVRLLEGRYTRWEEDEFALGSYSSFRAGSSPLDC